MLKETARRKIAELVEKYQSQIGIYESADYNEENVRNDFINPFFTALGWDIGNRGGFSELYRDVILEPKLPTKDGNKAPDYAFRIGRNTVFYTEAKKPSVNLTNSGIPAFQLRGYGWSSGLNVSILTNFKEFSVYDCRQEPNIKHSPDTARVDYLTWQNYTGGRFGLIEYEDKFDFLWNTFSKESVLRGGIEKYVESGKFEQGYISVDISFLKTMEEWRLELAKSVCHTNPNIQENELDTAVSEILNRILFLRFAEGREIEPHGNLLKTIEISEAGKCYKNLYTLFQRTDEKYNSGLFDLEHNNIGEHLQVNNDILKKIIKSIYYPNIYAFEVMPVEILGSVYERFLGKQIKLTSRHTAIIEPKPEVRKAGGVFYTPQYIVDYIVENTVGKLTEGKTPQDAAKIKVIDPSCGSGSFLLGVYQFLLDWHQYYYEQEYKRKNIVPKGLKSDTLTPEGKLTAVVKKQILLNNIFGVDIDAVAVDVAKLGLLLKCMEGETNTSIENTIRIFHEKVLPNIDGNVRCGNSLISNDFYAETDTDFTEKEQLRINAFDWDMEFPQVFKQGGFDAVIGNPPYVKKEHFSPLTIQTLQTIWGFAADLYVHFILKDYQIVKENGLVSLITNDGVLGFRSTVNIRKLFFANDLQQIVKCPAETFDATIYTAVFILCKRTSPQQCYQTGKFIHKIEHDINGTVHNFVYQNSGCVPYELSQHLIHNRLIFNDDFIPVFNRLTEFYKLNDICMILDTGMHTGNCRNQLLFRSRERKGLKKILQGRQIKRYFFNWNSPDAKYRYCDINYKPQNKLGVGRSGKKSKKKEYWHWCGDIKNHLAAEKILMRQTDDDLIACYVNKEEDGLYYTDNTLHTILPKNGISLKFILGILNSRLLNRIYHFVSQEHGKSMAQVKTQVVESLPFPPFDLTNKSDKTKHDRIVSLVNDMLKFKKQEQTLTLRQLEIIQRRIAAADKAIDILVYQLYGLTDEEIKLVEGQNSRIG